MEDCITAVPMPPGEAPMMPVGLRAKELVPQGREPQPMAFFRAPGTDRLYSGEKKRIPSEVSMGFILLDTGVGMAKRRRIRQTAMSEADGMATSASRDMQ